MESASKVQVIKEAIKQLMMEEIDDDDDDRHQHLLLAKLISQLEDEEEEGSMRRLNEEEEKEEDKILKEIKKVRRQNVITQCLVSVMILVTVAWQISEVSIILKLKDGVTHPFRSVGTIFKSLLIKPPPPPPLPSHHDDTPPKSNLIDSTPAAVVHDDHLNLPKIDLGFNLPQQD